jgi:uncharacterized Zn finger protein
MAYGHYYPPYVPVAQKRAKADKKLKQLKKKNPDIRPVRLEGQTLARSWWGKAWNKNLERYADFSNRIGRGRSYVRHNAVLDLQIEPGRVTSLVQGTSRNPYEVEIRIEEISKKNWKAMTEACEGRLETLQELLAGQFPKALADVFTAKGEGLFPTPAEIKFSCSCPDWASMCKHVAAALYGIGVRLDEDPSLFFTLRNRDVSDLVSTAVAEGTKTLLDRAEKKSDRVMDDADLSDVFGIDMEAPPAEAAEAKPKPAPKAKKATPKKPAKKAKKKEAAPAKPAKAAKAKKTAGKTTGKAAAARKTEKTARKKPEKTSRKTATKPAPRKPRSSDKTAVPKGKATAIDTVAAVIAKHPKGVGVADIRKATGFDDRKIYNIVHQLKEKGRIRSAGWGKYASA